MTIMTDSDSDSDDDFLQKSAAFNKSPSRQKQKKNKADSEYLEKFVASGVAFCSKKAKLGEIGAYKETSEESLSLSEQVQSMSKSNSHEQKKILKGLTGLYKDDFLPEDVLRARISSIQAGRRERHGERHVIHYDSKRATNPMMRFFGSTDEAIAALQQNIIENLQQQDATGSCSAPLRRLSMALQDQAPTVFTAFLETGRLGELIATNDGQMTGIEDICSWLFCSTLSFRPGDRLVIASKRALAQLLHLGHVPDGCWFKSWGALLDLLQVWIDKGVSTENENNESDAGIEKCAPVVSNMTGLANLLCLWDQEFAHDPNLELTMDIATALVVVLLRLALDGRIVDQLACIRRLLVAVTDRIQADFTASLAEWASATAQAVVTDISSFAEIPAEVDYKDCEGYLSCALMAESLPAETGPLKIALLNRSLEVCVGVPNWRNYATLTMPNIERKEKFMERASEDPWWCLLSALVAFESLCDESDECDSPIQRDRVRFQAIFLLALTAFDTAMIGLSQPTGGTKVVQEYGRKTEAGLMAGVLSRMEMAAETIKRLTKKNIQDSLWRSTNYLCTSFQNYLSHAAKWAHEQGGLTHKTKVQTAIKDYMKCSP